MLSNWAGFSQLLSDSFSLLQMNQFFPIFITAKVIPKAHSQ